MSLKLCSIKTDWTTNHWTVLKILEKANTNMGNTNNLFFCFFPLSRIFCPRAWKGGELTKLS